MPNQAFPAAESSTSSSLIARVARHESAAWERLVRVYSPEVYRWLRQGGLQDADSADAAQEVFRAVATNIRSFRHEPGVTSFRGWLWGITRNKLRDHFRRQQNQDAAAEGGTAAYQQFAQAPAPLDDSIDHTRNEARARLTRRVLEILQTEFEYTTWQAFWQSAVEERPTEEIAASLGLSMKAVRQAKYRVLKRLRQETDSLLDF